MQNKFFICYYCREEGGGQEGCQNVLIFYVLIRGRVGHPGIKHQIAMHRQYKNKHTGITPQTVPTNTNTNPEESNVKMLPPNTKCGSHNLTCQQEEGGASRNQTSNCYIEDSNCTTNTYTKIQESNIKLFLPIQTQTQRKHKDRWGERSS